ncbi:SMI1/KNR4 family protein [Alkalihalobacillus pseudalcaliphilus]|uniref:SMI1/KNR4 family protein n=1 Tax=Alkalihalobacillus pseudalcaliphilus TaxID=79884 RepID=UPI00064E10DC|nr:SMI1/KNR4 family protein [Alkalihalobacillus pseudalcaliphilus]KMK74649.1 cell wall assembly protein [Alkalihalobacillus pseudalcaliphilus]
MWKNYIQSIAPEHIFHPPANRSRIEAVQNEFNISLPEALIQFYQESNGVEEPFGFHLIWPIEKLRDENQFFRTNLTYRELFMPFDHLLFFSDAGNGDLFAFAISGNNVIEREEIYVWNHEDDSRSWIAPNLKVFLKRWTNGDISV